MNEMGTVINSEGWCEDQIKSHSSISTHSAPDTQYKCFTNDSRCNAESVLFSLGGLLRFSVAPSDPPPPVLL